MSKIILISCVSKKLNLKSKAKDIYVSSLFKKSLEYAELQNPDKIFILSAKYGLLKLNKKIEPYNQTLNLMTNYEKKSWSELVLKQLKKETNIKKDKFIFLAWDSYRKFIIPSLNDIEIPMEGLIIWEQLKFLSNNINCLLLHKYFNKLDIINIPFNKENIPSNWIYILFEKWEKYYWYNRIVRVWTHTWDNNLYNRIKEHFITENKDRSIFRKNIGRAILNKKEDSFLDLWNIDLTTRLNKDKYSWKIDRDYLKKIEKKVSKYMNKNFYFIVFEVDTKEKRLDFEEKIISTISNSYNFKGSEKWLGNYSPIEKIKNNWLWLIQGLNKTPLNIKETDEIIQKLNNWQN